jgi:8-oxo-dGTP diphosphatase
MADETAKLTADVVAFADTGRGELYVALIERRWPPFQGCQALPGGHLEPGETTEAAARRELAEETGLRPGWLKLVGAYAEPGRDPRGRYASWAYATIYRGTDLPRMTAGDDAAEATWWPVTTVLARPDQVAFDHLTIISDAVTGIGLQRR